MAPIGPGGDAPVSVRSREHEPRVNWQLRQHWQLGQP